MSWNSTHESDVLRSGSHVCFDFIGQGSTRCYGGSWLWMTQQLRYSCPETLTQTCQNGRQSVFSSGSRRACHCMPRVTILNTAHSSLASPLVDTWFNNFVFWILIENDFSAWNQAVSGAQGGLESMGTRSTGSNLKTRWWTFQMTCTKSLRSRERPTTLTSKPWGRSSTFRYARWNSMSSCYHAVGIHIGTFGRVQRFTLIQAHAPYLYSMPPGCLLCSALIPTWTEVSLTLSAATCQCIGCS